MHKKLMEKAVEVMRAAAEEGRIPGSALDHLEAFVDGVLGVESCTLEDKELIALARDFDARLNR